MTVKTTHYKEKQKDSETTSVTLLFVHTTRAWRAVDDDDEDDGAQEQVAPETNFGTRGKKKDQTLNSLNVCWGKSAMQTIQVSIRQRIQEL